jgi:tetratricopeptide (TPR) repeat protein
VSSPSRGATRLPPARTSRVRQCLDSGFFRRKGSWAGRLVLTIILTGGVALGSHQALGQKSPLAQAAYRRAQDHLIAARYAEAAVEMQAAVRYEPRFALGWYVLASASRRAGQCDRAVEAYRRYMELRPAEPDPYFGVALCLQTVGDRAGAMTAFRNYVAMDHRPASVQFVEIAGKQLVELEHMGPAAAAMTVHAALPQLVEARDLREHGRTDEAIARYRAAIAADANSAAAHIELGAVLVSVHRTKEAADELRTAVRLDPTAAPAWYNLAFALREIGQTSEAVNAYRRYITFKPHDPDPHYGLGRALVTLGRDEEALGAFRAYATLETRPTERRWLKKARAEIARIESARRPPSAAPTSPPAPAPLRASPPPASAPSTEPPAARQPG